MLNSKIGKQVEFEDEVLDQNGNRRVRDSEGISLNFSSVCWYTTCIQHSSELNKGLEPFETAKKIVCLFYQKEKKRMFDVLTNQ